MPLYKLAISGQSQNDYLVLEHATTYTISQFTAIVYAAIAEIVRQRQPVQDIATANDFYPYLLAQLQLQGFTAATYAAVHVLDSDLGIFETPPSWVPSGSSIVALAAYLKAQGLKRGDY